MHSCCSGRFATLLLLLGCSLLGSILAVCPNEADIRPCTCDDEGLQCVRLNDTQLMRVFQAQARRKAIRRVWIFQTNLTNLPKRAFGDYIIKDLYLDLNQIKHVHSEAFGDASNTLQSLSLTRNQLMSFPFESLRQMKRLKQLGLGHNQLALLPADAFASGAGHSLESVDLSGNFLRRIEPGALADLHEANIIDLSKNRLKNLESRSLEVKSSTRHLSISLRLNNIDRIAEDTFGEHHPLSIDLSRNKLTHLNQTVFLPLIANSTLIDLDDNPLTCWGCDQYKWLIETDPEITDNFVNFSCADGTKLDALTLGMIGCPNGNNVGDD